MPKKNEFLLSTRLQRRHTYKEAHHFLNPLKKNMKKKKRNVRFKKFTNFKQDRGEVKETKSAARGRKKGKKKPKKALKSKELHYPYDQIQERIHINVLHLLFIVKIILSDYLKDIYV